MVKTPPCSKYEPPRNILYTRNGKKFCRISKKGDRNGPQIPPCEQYGKNYVMYTKNRKKFCRKSTKKNKREKKINAPEKCYKINPQKLKKIANILNINLSKYNDNEWICANLEKIFNTSEPDKKDIKYVSKTLKISTRNKKDSELCKEISDKIINSNKDFNSIVNLVKKDNKIKEKELNNLVVNIVLSALYPSNFPHNSPIPISEDLYNELILKKVNNKPMTNEEIELLNISLYIKLCYCTKKMFLKSKFLKDVMNIDDKVNNYAICTNSVYKQRNIELPENATRNCTKNFKWLKKTDYIKKQKGGTNVGPYPPNKEIIKNNNVTSCFNSFEKEPVLNWPNRFACPSKKCNNWAGGKKSIKNKKYIKKSVRK